ncbi:hypothetical protein BDZ97DRAFT_1756817 [Flammula alnicola]|nr:hypothetical protein BDZ97DRAFT_1756817 [Flammula alnicola]
MAFGIKYVPLTPGIYPRQTTFPDLNASLPKFTEDQILGIKQNLEAFMRELSAERERDMAITKPTQPEYYARSRRPTVEVAPTQYTQPSSDVEPDFGFLDVPDDLFQSHFPPTTDDMDCDFLNDAEHIAQLDQLIAEAFPEGIPEDFDNWSVYPELQELQASIAAPEATEPMDGITFDEELFQKSLEEFDSVFGDIISTSISHSDSVSTEA